MPQKWRHGIPSLHEPCQVVVIIQWWRQKLEGLTVTDRFVQQVIVQMLTPVYEEQLHDHSYMHGLAVPEHMAVDMLWKSRIFPVYLFRIFLDDVCNAVAVNPLAAPVRDKRLCPRYPLQISLDIVPEKTCSFICNHHGTVFIAIVVKADCRSGIQENICDRYITQFLDMAAAVIQQGKDHPVPESGMGIDIRPVYECGHLFHRPKRNFPGRCRFRFDPGNFL